MFQLSEVTPPLTKCASLGADGLLDLVPPSLHVPIVLGPVLIVRCFSSQSSAIGSLVGLAIISILVLELFRRLSRLKPVLGLPRAEKGPPRYLRKKTRRAGREAQMMLSCSSSWAQM